jgi:glycosyltransferase involved in cell wall biosynthesis
MKIAVNTSCAVAGGAVTHLRHLVPELMLRIGEDELVLIGDAAMRTRIDPDGRAHWEQVDPIAPGLRARLAFENIELPRRLRAMKADVLFHPGNFSVFRCPIPQVNLLHNLAPFLPEVIGEESLFQKIRLGLLRGLTLLSLKVARRMIFISAWGRSLVLRSEDTDDLRFPVVPFGANHGLPRENRGVLERYGLHPGAFVLTVSHLYRYKKLEKLVEAYVLLGNRVRDLPLVVVGEPYDAEYTRRVAELGKASRGPILFTGGLPTDELVALMTACRVFVFTSEAENLPITLLEAMAADCAILTNRSCSMPEVCADAAIYADPATAERYAEKLSELLGDDTLRDTLRQRASQRASEFKWSDTAVRTLAILRESARGS